MSFAQHPDLAVATLLASPEGVAVVDPDGTVVACNPSAAELLGLPVADLEGSPFPIHPLEEGVQELARTGGPPRVVRLRLTETLWEERPATVVAVSDVGDRRSREDATEPPPRLREFVERARGSFFVSTAATPFLQVSPGAAEILGRSQADLADDDDPLDAVHAEDRDELRNLMENPARAPYETTYRLHRPDGTLRWIRQRGFPVARRPGDTKRVVGMLEDVTEQHEEQELLNHTLRLLRRTVSSLQEGVLVLDSAEPDWRILSSNPAAESIFGQEADGLLGESAEILHLDPDSFRLFREEATAKLEEDGVHQASLRLRRAGGATFPAELTVAWLDPEEGVDGGVVSVVRDLSQQRRARAELRASEERFRLLAERIDDVFWISSVDKGTMEYVSPAYSKVFGRPPEELYEDARRWVDHVLEEDRDRILAALPRQPLGTFEEEYRIRRPDGEIRWIWDRAFPVENARGRVVRLIGVAEDVTDRKRAEERFGALSREITDVLFVVDQEGTVRFTSYSVRHALGYTPDEFQDRNILEMVEPEDRAKVRSQLVAIQREGADDTARAQYRMRTRQGETLHVESIARNLLRNPAVEGIVLNTRDVTERLELEEQLLQSQKMEAVGRLAGGIAHDFNNLLTVIRAETDILLMDLDEDDPVREDIETIQSTGDRAAELTSQLLAFSRDQVLRPRLVDLSEVVRGLGTLLERIIGEDVRVVNDLADDLPPARVDPGQLEHVVMNLAINARDAMPEGGTLTLSTARDRVDPDLAATLGIAQGTYVAIRVTDTGVGMDEATRSRIFEPFFTTKGVGEGTGLGLAMAHGVVNQSGGDIQVKSRPGEGSTFTLRFPALEGAEAELAQELRVPEPLVGSISGTVLLVEDDEDVRRATQRILERAGLTVRAVERADEGLDALNSGGTPPDLVLTDLVLPGMSGRELVDRLRQNRPGLPIVVMSGYAAGSPGRRGDLPEEVAFIQKPFDPLELLRAIRDALDRR